MQGDERLGKQSIPKVQWEIRIGAAEAFDKVILERADHAFGGIASVSVRWCELIVDAFGLEEVLKRLRCFVVEALELWCESSAF